MVRINRQSGAAVLIALITIASVLIVYLVNRYGVEEARIERDSGRVASLAQAKQALIAYAVSHIDTTGGEAGFLPCPDTRIDGVLEEGSQIGNCGGTNVNSLGRLPWRTLNLPPQFDAANECIWYGVTGYYKESPTTEMLNEDTNGMFNIFDSSGTQIYGATPADRVVAVLIAPGESLGQQDRAGFTDTPQGTRHCRGNYTDSNYLEGNGVIDNSVTAAVADATDDFIQAGTNTENAATPFNDIIVEITRDDIWDAVKRRRTFAGDLQTLTNNIANCLLAYGNAGTEQNLPWPAAVDLGGNLYREDASYVDQDAPATLLGRLPNIVSNSEAQLATNGGGGGGGPGGGPACTVCWTDYQGALADLLQVYNDAIAQANQDYTDCIARGRNPRSCDAQLRNDIRRATRDYNRAVDSVKYTYANCYTVNSCTPGGGGGGSTAKLANPNDPIISTCLAALSADQETFWKHWKDHFFYVVSGDYAPDSTSVGCSGNCVSVGGVDRAAVLIYSGERTAGQLRNDPVSGGNDDRATLTNYLSPENTDADLVFDANDNDILYCINEGATLSAAVCN